VKRRVLVVPGTTTTEDNVKVCIANFEHEGELIRAGIDRVADDHALVRQYPQHFAQTRSPAFLTRTLSPSAANLANPRTDTTAQRGRPQE
jgi:hypothetical protein